MLGSWFGSSKQDDDCLSLQLTTLETHKEERRQRKQKEFKEYRDARLIQLEQTKEQRKHLRETRQHQEKCDLLLVNIAQVEEERPRETTVSALPPLNIDIGRNIMEGKGDKVREEKRMFDTRFVFDQMKEVYEARVQDQKEHQEKIEQLMRESNEEMKGLYERIIQVQREGQQRELRAIQLHIRTSTIAQQAIANIARAAQVSKELNEIGFHLGEIRKKKEDVKKLHEKLLFPITIHIPSSIHNPICTQDSPRAYILLNLNEANAALSRSCTDLVNILDRTTNVDREKREEMRGVVCLIENSLEQYKDVLQDIAIDIAKERTPNVMDVDFLRDSFSLLDKDTREFTILSDSDPIQESYSSLLSYRPFRSGSTDNFSSQHSNVNNGRNSTKGD